MSEAITFQVAREFNSPRFSQASWSGPRKITFRAVSVLLVRSVRTAIAALVQHEDVEMRTVVERAIDPAGLHDAFAHRIHFMERARRAGGEQGDVALLVGGRQLFRQRPVVA